MFNTATDFTFAIKSGRRRVPVATAGDCYSRTRQCPMVCAFNVKNKNDEIIILSIQSFIKWMFI